MAHVRVLEAKRFTVLGYGRIDLARESLDLEVLPLPTAGLGLSIGELIGGFRVTGPLAQPRVQLSASGLAASITLDALTGGFLARGIIRRVQGAQITCQSTFERLQQQ